MFEQAREITKTNLQLVMFNLELFQLTRLQ